MNIDIDEVWIGLKLLRFDGSVLDLTKKVLVSNTGKIYLLKSGKEASQTIKQTNNIGKYLRVGVRLTKKHSVCFPVHRAVASMFVDGYNVGLDIDHKDNNSLNNHWTNLHWIDRKTHSQLTHKRRRSTESC